MHDDIDLVRAELGELVDTLVDERRPSQPFGTYVLAPTDPATELGRHVERAVFLETFGDVPELLASEYAPYDGASVFFVVVDHRRRVPAGTIRVILPSPAGFKSLDDLLPVWGVSVHDVLRSAAPWDLRRLWDFATLAVVPDYRGEAALGIVTQALVQAIAMVGRRAGGSRFVAILDVPVLRMLQWRMGRPFERFPGLDDRPYLGSPASAAVWGDVAQGDARRQSVDPFLHELIFAGRGREPILSSPD